MPSGERMKDKLRIGCKFSFLNIPYQFQKETEKNNQLNFKIKATNVGPFGLHRGRKA
jgi:hypothetical protein